MMKSLYGTQRYERVMWWYNLEWNITLNWVYTASNFLNNQFSDWNSAWLTNVIDCEIPEDAYISEIVPWIKKLTRFIRCEYNEEFVDKVEFQRSLENVWRRFDIDILTVDEAKQWIRDNTNLVEESDWKFIISNETEFNWEIIPARYLEIIL